MTTHFERIYNSSISKDTGKFDPKKFQKAVDEFFKLTEDKPEGYIPIIVAAFPPNTKTTHNLSKVKITL